MRNKSLYFVLSIALGISFLFYSCANIHSLNGGEKDVTPPKDSVYFPVNFGVNFDVSEFSIEFDEYIKLNDIANQLIVSPPLNKKPKVIVKKKTLFVSFEDTLIPNTTYIFNFGNGVVDYTEGNAAKNLSYVFSTGSFLDSLAVSGNCKDAFTNETLEGVKVMLYNENIDSLPLTKKPFYFGITDKNGDFEIPYMKKGEYKVFCLKDDNGNYLYDEGESMGFLTELVSASIPDSLQKPLAISMSVAEPRLQAIVDQRTDSSGFVVMAFAKKPKNLSFDVLDLDQAEYKIETAEDSTYFWITKSDVEDKIFKLVVADEGNLLDTLYLLYYPNQKTKIDWKLEPKTTAIAVDSAFTFGTYHSYLNSIDQAKFLLKEDSIEIPMTASFSSQTHRKILIKGKFEESKKYDLEVLPNAISTIHGVKNDTLRYSFNTKSNSSFGSIIVSFEIDDSLSANYLVQLVDSKNKLYFQKKMLDNAISISRLEAKKYTLRLVEDKNDNNQWDAGDYLNKIQPEKCIYFPEAIEVKPNWVLEYEWIINEKN